MPAVPQISDAEWEVMKAVWEAGPATAGEIVRHMGDARGDARGASQSWAPRTIKTLLGRLVGKGAVGVAKDGSRFIYRARVTREACIRGESRSFLDRVFDGAAAPALAHFIRDARLSQAEIEELKRILDEEGR